jgi:T-complex protein 1 subunit alpha
MRRQETQQVQDYLKLLVSGGATVIVSSKGMDEMALSFLARRGCMAITRVKHKDLVRIAAATKTCVLTSMEAEIVLGHALRVQEISRGDTPMILVESPRVSTLLVSGPNPIELKRFL